MKNRIKVLALLGLLIPGSLLSGMEDKSTLEQHKKFLAEQKQPSSFMHWINKHVGRFISLPISSAESSNDEKKRWQEIQSELNIPGEYHLPIKKFSESSIFSKTNLVALTGTRDMHIHQNFNNIPWGMQRFTLYHEGMHHKYLDPFKGNTLFTGVFISTLLASKKISKMFSWGNRWYATAFRLASSYGLGIALYKTQSRYAERRADIDAAHSIKCHTCLNDVTKMLTADNEEMRVNDGYLPLEEFKAVAQEHKNNGSVCEHHKNK